MNTKYADLLKKMNENLCLTVKGRTAGYSVSYKMAHEMVAAGVARLIPGEMVRTHRGEFWSAGIIVPA